MKKEKGKEEEEKPITVVEKWNRDIKGMRETAKSMKETAKNLQEQSIKRANMRMEAFRNSFTNDIKQIETTLGNLRKEAKAFTGQCHREIRSMQETLKEYKAKFENDINGMRDIVKGMEIHIWGTTA